MTLTRQLKDTTSPLRCWFERELPDLRQPRAHLRESVRAATTLRPIAGAPGYPWSDVGTALDHRAGLALGAPDLRIAYRGAGHLLRLVEAEHGRATAQRLEGEIDTFLDAHVRRCAAVGLPGGRPDAAAERILAQEAFTVALLEVACRIGADPHSPLVVNAAALDTAGLGRLATIEVVEDLVALAGVAHDVLAPAVNSRGDCHLGPVFTDSVAVGGADADLIADGLLLEIKVTVKTNLRREWFYQLLGYALLDTEDEFGLEEVGFFLARQAVVLTWYLPDLLDQLSGGRHTSMAGLRDNFHRFVVL